MTNKIAFVPKLLVGATAINKAIDSIAKRGKTLDTDLHNAALSCLEHAIKHGDITLAERLVGAMPQQARKNAMRDWFINYGPFAYNAKNKKFTFKAKEGEVYNVAEAAQTPFWEFKPEPEYVPFNVDKAILALVTKAENAVKEHGVVIDENKLRALKALAA